MSKLIDVSKLKTSSMRLVIIGFLIGAGYVSFKSEMEDKLSVPNDCSIFDIAMSQLEDRGVVSITKVIVENENEPMWLISLNIKENNE